MDDDASFVALSLNLQPRASFSSWYPFSHLPPHPFPSLVFDVKRNKSDGRKAGGDKWRAEERCALRYGVAFHTLSSLAVPVLPGGKKEMEEKRGKKVYAFFRFCSFAVAMQGGKVSDVEEKRKEAIWR